MEIKTQRLLVRPFCETDGDDLYEYLSDPEVVRYEPYDPFTPEGARKEAVERSKNPDFWAVVLDGKVIGNIWCGRENDYTFEMGWVFNRAYQHKGYATEAARAVLAWAFETGKAHRVIAMCNPENKASWMLMERLSMRRELVLLKNVFFTRNEKNEPNWQDTWQYAILREEWEK